MATASGGNLGRLFLAGIAIVVACFFLHFYLRSVLNKTAAGELELNHLIQVLRAWAFAALLAGSSRGYGALVFGRLSAARAARPVCGERQLVETGVGAGLIILLLIVVLAVGALGWLSIALVLAPGAIAAVVACGLRLLSATSPTSIQPRLHPTTAVLICVLVVLGLLAITPPRDYDVLEYHLPAASAWAEEGRFTLIPANVYTNFPMNIEVLYAAGLSVAGERAPKAIHFTLGLGALWGTWLLGARLGGVACARWAALLFVSSSIIAGLMSSALIDLGAAFFGVCTVCACLRWSQSGRARDAAIVGVLAGLALGCKYTTTLVVLVPAAAMMVCHASQRALRERLLHLMIIGLAALAVFSPWAIKNLIFTGNPVFPLLYGVFGGEGWSAERAAIFMDAHRSELLRHPHDALPELGKIFVDWFTGSSVLFTAFLICLPILPWRRMPALARALLIYLACASLLWLMLTQGADRFLAPVLPVVAALCAWAVTRIEAPALRALYQSLLVLLVVSGLWGTAREAVYSYPQAVGQIVRGADWLDYRAYYFLQAMEIANQDPTGRVLFVGEARSYGCRVRHVAPTVFDDHPLLTLTAHLPVAEGQSAPEGNAIVLALRKAGFTHILYNEVELERLERFSQHGWKDGPLLRARVEAVMACCAVNLESVEVGMSDMNAYVFEIGEGQ